MPDSDSSTWSREFVLSKSVFPTGGGEEENIIFKDKVSALSYLGRRYLICDIPMYDSACIPCIKKSLLL